MSTMPRQLSWSFNYQYISAPQVCQRSTLALHVFVSMNDLPCKAVMYLSTPVLHIRGNSCANPSIYFLELQGKFAIIFLDFVDFCLLILDA